MPTVKTCCLACSTRTGSVCIAIVNVVVSLFIAVAGSIYLAVVISHRDLERKYYHFIASLLIGLTIVVSSLVYVALASLMIHGIRKERCRLMLPWLVVQIALTLLSPFSFTLLFGPGFEVIRPLGISAVVLHVYFLIVVYSCYEELRIRKKLVKGSVAPADTPWEVMA